MSEVTDKFWEESRFEHYNAIVKFPCHKEATIPEEYATRSRECRALLEEPLKAIARKNGYCLCFHSPPGSVRDIDVLAVPWMQVCAAPVRLAEQIAKACRELCGHALANPLEDEWWHHSGCPGSKPHGRLVWTFHLGGGPYLDLSVMPPTER